MRSCLLREKQLWLQDFEFSCARARACVCVCVCEREREREREREKKKKKITSIKGTPVGYEPPLRAARNVSDPYNQLYLPSFSVVFRHPVKNSNPCLNNEEENFSFVALPPHQFFSRATLFICLLPRCLDMVVYSGHVYKVYVGSSCVSQLKRFRRELE